VPFYGYFNWQSQSAKRKASSATAVLFPPQ
jgi:hypothetical protein